MRARGRQRPSGAAGPRARVAALIGRLDLRDRATLATAGVLAGGLAVLSAGAMLLLSGQLDHDVSSVLRERADAQLAAVEQVDGRTVVRAVPGGALGERAWVFDASGRALHRPHAGADVQRAAASLAGAPPGTTHDVGEEVRLLSEPARAGRGGERIGTVVAGVSLEPYERTEHLALLSMAFLDLCIVVLGALLARRAVGKALQPVADMTAHAADWSEHDLDRRFDLGPPRDELTALSATLDRLLARIGASMRREQRFSAEMAHELRTPLSGVRGEAELALRLPGTPPEARDALEQIMRGTDRMQGVIDALLAAARGEGAAGGVCDASAAARTAVDAAAATAADAGVTVTVLGDMGGAAGASEVDAVDVPLLRVGAEQRLVVQSLAPLLDNAIRHASSRVAVRVERDGADVLLHVVDDGAGIAVDELESIFVPGVGSSGSTGLGLALARRVARSAGGDVTARVAAAGGSGAQLVLRLPALG